MDKTTASTEATGFTAGPSPGKPLFSSSPHKRSPRNPRVPQLPPRGDPLDATHQQTCEAGGSTGRGALSFLPPSGSLPTESHRALQQTPGWPPGPSPESHVSTRSTQQPPRTLRLHSGRHASIRATRRASKRAKREEAPTVGRSASSPVDFCMPTHTPKRSPRILKVFAMANTLLSAQCDAPVNMRNGKKHRPRSIQLPPSPPPNGLLQTPNPTRRGPRLVGRRVEKGRHASASLRCMCAKESP